MRSPSPTEGWFRCRAGEFEGMTSSPASHETRYDTCRGQSQKNVLANSCMDSLLAIHVQSYNINVRGHPPPHAEQGTCNTRTDYVQYLDQNQRSIWKTVVD